MRLPRPGERREAALGAVIVVAVLLGLAIEGLMGEVATPGAARAAGARFSERALYCPPPLGNTDAFAIATQTVPQEVALGLEPSRPGRVELPPGRIFVQQAPGEVATDVVGYGAQVRAGTLTRARGPVVGEAAARCAERASARWFFAAGASTLGVDQRLLIYNPFPDEAVVRVAFLTSRGEDVKGRLADVPVPSKSSRVIAVNEFIRLERALGVRIDAQRGRVVAWRMLFDAPKGGPRGVQMSLGAPAASDTWFFPDGSIGEGTEEWLSVVNPSAQEATVTVTLSAGGQIVQTPELVEVAVPAGSVRRMLLSNALPRNQRDLGGVSAVVESTNGVGVVVERVVRYDGGNLMGSAAEIGATRTARSWMLPPASLRPTTDALVVMNPSAEAATLDVSIMLEDGRPLEPDELQGRELPPGGRIKIGLTPWTAQKTAMVRVESSSPVIAERFSYSEGLQDAAAVMGFPLS